MNKFLGLFLLLILSLTSDFTLRAESVSAIRKIDGMVEKAHKENGIVALPTLGDETFLRRIYLDIAGRIPTHKEALAFLNSKEKAKRNILIDKLLNSKAYVSNSFNYWADILRIKTRVSGTVYGTPYIDWLKDSLSKNQAYDEMVRELITAEGSSWSPGNGATGYYLRDTGMAEDNMSNTAQIFLGTQLACAQCHNHPFDKWKRKEFYEMLAFTSGISFKKRKGAKDSKKLTKSDLRKFREYPVEVRKVARRMVLAPEQGVFSENTSQVSLPKDYQYSDGKPLEKVSAHTIFGKDLVVNKEDKPREIYADWLTSSQNERFTKVIANRMWKKVMGRGLIEPVDDIKDSTEASHPELLAFLEKEMINRKYDLKSFLGMLYKSKSYQRESYKKDLNPAKTYQFPGPLRGRLTAEQIWDSILTIGIDDIDSRKADVSAQNAMYKNFVSYEKLSSTELLDLILKESKERMSVRDAGKELKGLMEELKAARNKGDNKKMREIRGKLMKLRKKRQEAGGGKGKGGKGKGSGKEGNNNFLVRASESMQPTTAQHFLRLMGQSDRELIQGANLDPNATQVLAFYNSFVDKVLLMGSTPLNNDLRAAKTDEAKFEAMFLTLLSRRPSEVEKTWLKEYLGDSTGYKRIEVYKDMVWVLLNTHEFIFAK